MRKPTFILLAILISYLGLVLYANRALYFSRFDEAYWKDKYEHSQWKLPLSIRTIGDDGLYLYEGYRLIRGGDPTTINAEMPPLGKYLIGATILIFHNAFVYGMWTMILLLLCMFVLARRMFRHTLPALVLTVLLATDPLITSQYALTMLDGIQAMMLMVFLIALFHLSRVAKKNQILVVIASGIVLGLFSQTKTPILTPIVAACSLAYMWITTKKPTHLLWFLFFAATGYLLPYLSYFLQGHTLLEWLNVQKWMASFYLRGTITATWGSVVTTLVAGRFQNIFSRGWETAPQWSPTWGLLFFAAIGGIFRFRSVGKSRTEWGVIFALLFLILGLYMAVPFWTRYITVILPLLYMIGALVAVRLPTKLLSFVVVSCIILNLVTSLPILFPTPRATVHQFIHNTQYMLFPDLYEDVTTATKRSVSRDTFRRFGLQTMADGQIERIEIIPKTIPSGRASPQILDATITYFTRELGSFREDVRIPFVREDNRWRIPWEWSYLLPGLSETTHLETRVAPARRGSILASDKTLLAYDAESYLVSITPHEIEPTQERELLLFLERLFGPDKSVIYLHQRIYGNSLGDKPVPVGIFSRKLTSEEYTTLTNYRGVTLTPHVGRFTGKSDIVTIGHTANTDFFECCSYLYSTTTYDGATGVEKAKNDILKGYNGGTLVLKDEKGTILKTFIAREKVDGNDVEP